MAGLPAVVDIISRHVLSIDKPLIHIYSHESSCTMYIHNNTLHFSYKGGVVCMGVVCVYAYSLCS